MDGRPLCADGSATGGNPATGISEGASHAVIYTAVQASSVFLEALVAMYLFIGACASSKEAANLWETRRRAALAPRGHRPVCAEAHAGFRRVRGLYLRGEKFASICICTRAHMPTARVGVCLPRQMVLVGLMFKYKGEANHLTEAQEGATRCAAMRAAPSSPTHAHAHIALSQWSST